MALIPPQFVQSNAQFDALFGSGSHTTVSTFSSNVTAGNLLITFFIAENPNTLGQGDSVSIGAISDTVGSTWHSVAASSVGFFPPAFSNTNIWYAFANASGANTISVASSGTGPQTKSLRLDIAEWKNVGAFVEVLDVVSTSNPATAPSLTTTQNNTLVIVCETDQGSVQTFSGKGWTIRINSGSFGAPVLDNNVGQPGNTPSLSAANNTPVPYYAASLSFTSAPPTAVTNHNGFFEDYPGMPWMKNVAFLTRQYWDQGLSAPYVGQIYPSPNTGGARSGQTYPY